MNESQKILVIECFAAAKYRNPKSRRYTENWLMLCLLLNIRSPSAYKYLRESALLPLLHPKTVRSHLASINTACGFDKDFLSLLKKKCDQMTDIAKHGILLFDSINLRKSIAVNLSNLTYYCVPVSDLNPNVAESRESAQLLIALQNKHLLENCNFEYVLTGKIGQDLLETFFGTITQVSDPNDHLTTPTFLHLYKILSVYSVLKLPKFSNCTITNTDAPKLSLEDLREIFHNKTNERYEKINRLRTKLDQLVEDGIWEPCDIFPQVSNGSDKSNTRDWLIYYLCGYVTKKILIRKQCASCILFLKSSNINHPTAGIVVLKSKGQLIYPNTFLFEFLSIVEHSFERFCMDYVFEKVVEDITENNFNFKYSCSEHKVDVACEIIVYYLQMRLCQFSYQDNLKQKKVSREKKKISKLYNT
ncbi:hypothetical protein AGLY_018194 [Aphis glycines]|uniref:Transposable element P transposase-like RNase H domain-containing protein n=1 Tax=Aphis glycines TaxID=307491 RepID=A0A6G0SSY1_APHGL|nr:hypothetical protein AGLY_018194 [Aphis glycines]